MTALEKAAWLLARQDYSSNNLRLKLKAKYSQAEIDSAIETLQSRGYLNDAETCRQKFEYLYAQDRLSCKEIYAKLYKQGFSSDLIKALLPAESEERDLRVATQLFKKKFSRTDFKVEDYKERLKLKNKIYTYLVGKGFSSAIVSTLLEEEDFFE